MNKYPLISIVMPVYNFADKISPALDSAIAQTYPNYEVVVVDDGSTDALAEVINRNYKQIRFIQHWQNLGLSAARNTGVRASHGEFIAFLDADDLWSPDKLLLQIEDFIKHKDAVLSYTDILGARKGISNPYSRTCPLEKKRRFEQLNEENPVLPSTWLFRKQHYISIGGEDDDFLSAGDRDFLLRLSTLGNFCFLDLPLSRRVAHPNNLSKQNPEKWEKDYLLVIDKFLLRPEGKPYQHKKDIMYARIFLRIAGRFADIKRWDCVLEYMTRAYQLDSRVINSSPRAKSTLRNIAKTIGVMKTDFSVVYHCIRNSMNSGTLIYNKSITEKFYRLFNNWKYKSKQRIEAFKYEKYINKVTESGLEFRLPPDAI